MARCTETTLVNGSPMQCEVDGEHEKALGDNGGEVDVHYVTLYAPEGHQGPIDPETGERSDDSGKPYTSKWYDPTLA